MWRRDRRKSKRAAAGTPRRKCTRMPQIQLFPTQASTMAPAGGRALLLPGRGDGVLRAAHRRCSSSYFAIKYRRRSTDEVGAPHRRQPGARDHLDGHPARHRRWSSSSGARRCSSTMARPPAETLDDLRRSASSGCGSSSTPTGQREINELHVPVGRPVKLTMTSRGRASTASSSRRSASRRTWCPGRYTHALVRGRRSRAGTTCSARSTAARSTPA